MSAGDDDGFIYVSYKKKKQKKGSVYCGRKCTRCKCIPAPRDSSVYLPKLDNNKIQKLQRDMETSDFFEEFKQTFSIILQKWKSAKKKNELSEIMDALSIAEPYEPIDIICYGLGSFSSCLIARYQLAFLLALKNFLDVKDVSLYDPIFSSEEKICLKELGFNVLTVNEKAKRTVVHKTVFFMPHCDLPLYNNLLWSNWNINTISKLIVIGNSFSCYTRLPNSNLQKRGCYINFANQFVTEVKLLNNYVYVDIFNDMSIHYFENESISRVSPEIWLKTEEPAYESEDSINYS